MKRKCVNCFTEHEAISVAGMEVLACPNVREGTFMLRRPASPLAQAVDFQGNYGGVLTTAWTCPNGCGPSSHTPYNTCPATGITPGVVPNQYVTCRNCGNLNPVGAICGCVWQGLPPLQPPAQVPQEPERPDAGLAKKMPDKNAPIDMSDWADDVDCLCADADDAIFKAWDRK